MRSPLSHNPLDDAARKVDDVARRTKSPQFERIAIFTMVASAITTVLLAGFQAYHMFRREIRDELRDKEKERGRRPDPASPPPDRAGYGGTATAGMPPHGRDDGEPRRWTRREEHAEAAAPGRQR
jgi:hypothetical protein